MAFGGGGGKIGVSLVAFVWAWGRRKERGEKEIFESARLGCKEERGKKSSNRGTFDWLGGGGGEKGGTPSRPSPRRIPRKSVTKGKEKESAEILEENVPRPTDSRGGGKWGRKKRRAGKKEKRRRERSIRHIIEREGKREETKGHNYYTCAVD